MKIQGIPAFHHSLRGVGLTDRRPIGAKPLTWIYFKPMYAVIRNFGLYLTKPNLYSKFGLNTLLN